MQCPIFDKEALESVGGLLNLPGLGGEDWDLLWADADRVEEFCEVYEREPLGPKARVVLMQLIVSSYNIRLKERGPNGELNERIGTLLRGDLGLHGDTVEYWGALRSDDEEDEGDGFAVSPLMREVMGHGATGDA
jgi:hypothetical protein